MNRIGVIGLGYVGLPLGLALADHNDVIGFDIDETKINVLRSEIPDRKSLNITSHRSNLKGCDIFIVAVPTPVDAHNVPDLGLLKQACRLVGEFIDPEALVIFESTVFPGATQRVAGKELMEVSGLSIHNDDSTSEKGHFYLGYSPERINPGDNEHSLVNVKKVVSGSSSIALKKVRDVYSKIVEAGLVEASSIEVAEAAKVIENVQRDVNIALMNEFAKSFDALGLKAREVFEVAGSKWNFLNFTPGLVGGHCIGVDPYYFLYETSRVGLDSPIIRNSRLVNESMVEFVSMKVAAAFRQTECLGNSVGVLGVTFKDNCDDIRNSKNLELCKVLLGAGYKVRWLDPLVKGDIEIEGCKRVFEISEMNGVDGLIYAVDHREFLANEILTIDYKFLIDLQNKFSKHAYWSL